MRWNVLLLFCKVTEHALNTRIRLIALLLIVAGAWAYFEYIDKPNGFIDNARTTTWKNALIYYKQHWVFGYGIGHWKTFGNTYAEKYNFKWMNKAHNDILQGLFVMGPMFIALLLCYTASAIKRYEKAAIITYMALLVILVNCLVNFLFQISTLSMIAVTWVAILEIQLRENRQWQ